MEERFGELNITIYELDSIPGIKHSLTCNLGEIWALYQITEGDRSGLLFSVRSYEHDYQPSPFCCIDVTIFRPGMPSEQEDHEIDDDLQSIFGDKTKIFQFLCREIIKMRQEWEHRELHGYVSVEYTPVLREVIVM